MYIDVDLIEADGGCAGKARQNIAVLVGDLDAITGGGICVKEEAGTTGSRVRISQTRRGQVPDRNLYDWAVGKVAVLVLHFQAIEIISGIRMRVVETVFVLA